MAHDETMVHEGIMVHEKFVATKNVVQTTFLAEYSSFFTLIMEYQRSYVY